MGAEPAKIQQTVKFGRDFELNPGLYELRRSNRVLKLERIPMEILLLLVNERGRIVGRQEIVDHVWGKGVSLDADNSINGAIRKIRQVLKDDPEQPRFIQTVTGRGYRFVAPVVTEERETVDSAESEADKEQGEIGSTAPSEIPPSSTSSQAAQPSDSSRVEAAASSDARSAVRHAWFGWQFLVAVAVLIVAGSALVWLRHTRSRPVPDTTIRLAVLPFQNLTGDASQEYFSDGFTEEMITQLGSMDPQRLAVIARTSVMYYKNSHSPLPQIAHDLGIQYVVEGSIRRDADHVRITAQLIQVRDQTHVWAREYDPAPKDLLTIQSEIARAIADEVELALNHRMPSPSAVRVALSPQEYEAYDLYLKGRYLWRKRTPDSLRDSVSWFKQAVAKDPGYAPAYAGLADSYAIMSSYGFVAPSQYMPLAKAAALKAVQLDDLLAEAHTSLALIAENYDWDWQTAENEYRRAIQLNSNYATAHHWLAECLAYQGRFEEAFRESEKARELDPLSLIIVADRGAIYYFSRQYDRAIDQFKGVLEVDPSVGRAQLIIDAYVQQGRYADALAELQEWRRQGDGPWISAKEAYIYGRSGDTTKARLALNQIQKWNRAWQLDPIPLFSVAYAGAGDKEKWLATLQQAYQQHSNLVTVLKVDPMYDPLRTDPRFQDLLRRVGLNR
ncbi:MAG: winged helix-turn-helix domain-containing protein [Candidatus Sulfotelmatobacter sp.]